MAGSVYGKLAYGTGMYSRAVAPDFAGDLPIQISFRGDLDAALILHGDLKVNISSGMTATFSNPVDYRGQLDVGAVLFGGSPYRQSDFVGDLPIQINLQGALQLSGLRDLAGDLNLSVAFNQPRLNFVYDMSGDVTATVTAGGPAEVGPLWQEDAPCPVEPWRISELCPG